MRILSLGLPMPGASVHNHTFANAPTFFDYDALVVDPQALSLLIEDVISGSTEHRTRSGETVLDATTTPSTVDLADLLRDRRVETIRLLDHGGIVVCLAYPNVHHQVSNLAEWNRYSWLPTPTGLEYDEPFLRRGTGSEIAPSERVHPFGSFIDEYRGKYAYQAYFEDPAASLDGIHVIARSTGGAAVAVELSLGAGRIVFLPPLARPPKGEQRYAYSNALQEAIRQMLRLSAASSPPSWLAEYDLPSLKERMAGRDSAQNRLTGAQGAFEAEDESVREIDRFRRLLWQEGKYGLEEPVREAFALLGCKVSAQDIDTPAQVYFDTGKGTRQTALLEVDASVDAVALSGHYRLRQRLEQAIAAGKPNRGILIINGYRTKDPSQRPAQCSDSLRTAAETMRYCVATAEQLFHAVRAALAGDDATVAAFHNRLLTTEGVLHED